jgi:hypothetical protein
MRRCQTTNKGRGFYGWVKLELKQGLDLVPAEQGLVVELKQGLDLVPAEVNKVHVKGENLQFS